MSACPSLPIALLAAHSASVCEVVAGSAIELARPDLLVALAAVADPRNARGVRHRLVTVLAAAVCAVLAGARSYVAIAEWAHDLPVSVRVRLGIARRAPSESTFRRVLRSVDPEALDRIVSAWLAERAARQPAGAQLISAVGMRAIAVDGKTARGARAPDGRAVHLLAAFDHTSGMVLGQGEVDGKTNEVRREAPCRIPDSVRRNLEGDSWARWLTWTRKGMGTIACHEHWWSCPEAGVTRQESPRDMAKPGLAKPQSPAMQVFIYRKRPLKPVPRPAPCYLVGGAASRALGDAQ